MKPKIGIIGGGLSGTLVATKLLQQYHDQVEIMLFERSPQQLFRGIAYSSSLRFQPLNVRAKQMNLWSAKPGHFYHWIDERWTQYLDNKPNEIDFVRRDAFGDYLEEQFQQVKNETNGSVSTILEEVTSIDKDADRMIVSSTENQYTIDVAVLALGNFLPGDIPIPNKEFYQTTFYQANPWNIKWMDDVASTDPVFFIGSGLTTIDQVINLLERGHQGKICIMSRRGFLPKPHSAYVHHELAPLFLHKGISVSQVVSVIRQRIKECAADNIDWRNVIDCVRQQVPEIWELLTVDERKRFLRHVRPFWEIHRHRIPEQSEKIINKKISTGQIEILAGRLIDAQAKDNFARLNVKLRNVEGIHEFVVKKVINCTGPQSDFRKIDQPLIQHLMNKGWLRSDELNLGIDVDSNGQLIGANGKSTENLFAIGSLRKGAMWECTALREIVLQADKLVAKLNFAPYHFKLEQTLC